MPVAVETLGALVEGVQSFVEELGLRIARVTGEEPPTVSAAKIECCLLARQCLLCFGNS